MKEKKKCYSCGVKDYNPNIHLPQEVMKENLIEAIKNSSRVNIDSNDSDMLCNDNPYYTTTITLTLHTPYKE